jgi:hypothetical protein
MSQNKHISTFKDIVPEILNTLTYNWVKWLKQLKFKCENEFGNIGQAIISGVHSTLPKCPAESDVNAFNTRIYDIDESDNLTRGGERKLENDIKRYDRLVEVHEKDDTACLKEIRTTISSKSLSLVETSAEYAIFKSLKLGNRATQYLAILQTLHSAADAGTIQQRNKTFFGIGFDTDIVTSVKNSNNLFSQFVQDLGPPPDPTRPFHFDVRVFLSFILRNIIAGAPHMANFLDRELCNPTDPCAPDILASNMIKFELAHNTRFIQEHPPSSQGQAYAATTTPPLTKNARSDNPSKPPPKNTQIQGDPNKPHCPVCFGETGRIFNNHGHSDKNKCHRIPSAPKPPLTQFNRAYAASASTQPLPQSPLPNSTHNQPPPFASYPVTSYYQQGDSPSSTSQPSPNQYQHHQPLTHPQSYLGQQAVLPPPSYPQLVYHPSPSPPFPSPHQLPPHFPSAYFTQAPPQHHNPTPSLPHHHQTHPHHQPSAYMAHHPPAPLPSPFEAAARALCENLQTADPSETTTALFATLLDNFDRST